MWCPSTNRCSNGLDRYRQDWLMRGCDKQQILSVPECLNKPFDVVPTQDYDNINHEVNINNVTAAVTTADRVTQEVIETPKKVNPKSKASVSGVLAIFLLVALIASVGIWILYAYKNPHSTSGQILIKVRFN